MQLFDEILKSVAGDYDAMVNDYNESVDEVKQLRTALDNERKASKRCVEDACELINSIVRKPIEVESILEDSQDGLSSYKPTEVAHEEIYAKFKKHKLAFDGVFVGGIILLLISLWEAVRGQLKKSSILIRFIAMGALTLLTAIPFKLRINRLKEQQETMRQEKPRIDALQGACLRRAKELAEFRGLAENAYRMLLPARGTDYYDLDECLYNSLGMLNNAVLRIVKLLNAPLLEEG